MPKASVSRAPARAPSLAPWQPKGDKAGKPCALKGFDPAAKPFSSGDKESDRAAVLLLAAEIDALQEQFFIDKRYKLLVILQGTDTSGKDGTVRGVFGQVSPLGVHTMGWKAPTEEERAHDYLWRIHRLVPGAGEIMIFNRSHYEDVLVPAVNGWIKPEQVRDRFRQINDFERMLAENGTVILKFMLHIGKEEQRVRLQERVDDPAKHWKFSMGDIEVRKQWPQYQKAYEALLGATSTDWAPWTIVPANSKTHRNLMIATVVRDTLKGLKLRNPPSNPAFIGLKIK